MSTTTSNFLDAQRNLAVIRQQWVALLALGADAAIVRASAPKVGA